MRMRANWAIWTLPFIAVVVIDRLPACLKPYAIAAALHIDQSTTSCAAHKITQRHTPAPKPIKRTPPVTNRPLANCRGAGDAGRRARTRPFVSSARFATGKRSQITGRHAGAWPSARRPTTRTFSTRSAARRDWRSSAARRTRSGRKVFDTNEREVTPPRPPTNGRQRVVFHVDMDCFFAWVAIQANPSLRGKPVAVCHSSGPSSNSEISSCTYEARKYGVHAGMWLQEARRKCPALVTAP